MRADRRRRVFGPMPAPRSYPHDRRRHFSNADKRRILEAADLAALAPQRRGPKIPANRAETLQIAQLTRERDGLKRELDKAMLVIGVQKKLATLLGTLSDDKGEKL